MGLHLSAAPEFKADALSLRRRGRWKKAVAPPFEQAVGVLRKFMSAFSQTAPVADLPILAPDDVVSSGDVSA